jgi:hypothetical protein
MPRLKSIEAADLAALSKQCEDLAPDLESMGRRLQGGFMYDLPNAAQTLQAAINLQRALGEVQAGLAIRLALREQQQGIG